MTERRKTCLQCGEPIEQTVGRRERKFCKGKSCSQKHWLSIHPKEERFKRIPIEQKVIELPKDYVNWKSVGILKADGTIEELKDISQLPEIFQLGIKAMQSVNDDRLKIKYKDNEKKDLSETKSSLTKPEKLKGESAIDYRIRCEELKNGKSSQTKN